MEAPRRPWLGLLLAALVYVALRALVLHTAFDAVAMPQYELFPMGTIPLLVGVEGGLPVARVYDNAAGQLLTGLLAWIPYQVLGPTYLALKLVPFTLGLATLVLVWLIVRAAAGLGAANFAALLFAVGPTTVTKYSLLASGNHFETLCFTALALWSFLRMHRLGVTPRRLFASALASGFAVFVFLGALIPVGLIALAHLALRGWRDTLRDSAWLVGGFAVGLGPLVIVNLLAGARGAEFVAAKFGGKGTEFEWSRCGSRSWEFFTQHLPVASKYPNALGLSGTLADRAFLALFVVVYALALPGALRALGALARGAIGRGSPRGTPVIETLIVTYLPLTALAYAFSNLEIEPKPPPLDCEGYRYFNTHFLLAIVLIALVARRLYQQRAALARVLGGVALACGAFNFAIPDWSFAHAGVGNYYEGFNLKQVSNQLIAPRNGYSSEQIVAMVESYPRPYRSWLYLGLGRGRAGQQWIGVRGASFDLPTILAEFPEQGRDDVARGFAVFHRYLARRQSRLDARFVEYLSSELARGAPHVEAAIQGLATDWEVHLERDGERDMRELDALLAEMPEALAPHFARGYGTTCGRLLQRGIPSDLERVRLAPARIPGALLPQFYEGLGAGLAEGLDAPRATADLRAFLPGDADLDAIERGRERRRRETGI